MLLAEPCSLLRRWVGAEVHLVRCLPPLQTSASARIACAFFVLFFGVLALCKRTRPPPDRGQKVQIIH